MAEQISDEFRTAMANWVEIKTQLAEARKDMKVLNNREKQLKEFIKDYMKNQKLDLINLKKGKVTIRTTMKRATFTKDAVQAGLTVYFNGDEVSVERAMTCIVDNLPTSEAEVISLTGLEKKTEK
jgi:hypothetical protein